MPKLLKSMQRSTDRSLSKFFDDRNKKPGLGLRPGCGPGPVFPLNIMPASTRSKTRSKCA